MSSLPVDVNTLIQGSEATLIPDEGVPVIYPQVADTTTQLEAMRVVCYQLWQILDTPYNLSNAAQLGEHQVLRDSAISWIYPQITLTATQLEFVWVTYYQLLQIYGSLQNESNATQLGGHQVLRDSAISQIYQVALAAMQLEFVLVACHQLLQVYGMLPSENNATQLGEHQVLADNASQIQPPTSDTAQPTDAQEVGVPTGGDRSNRLHCHYENCKGTFGRPQEHKRHLIDVHTPRRRCPFCLYEWSRPNKIKTHLMKNHQDKVPRKVLNEIRAKRGWRLLAFLNNAFGTAL
ncbi:hypothetical protein EDB86DRAFT_2936487 [Lactarius hatsudake]|nr:hypothetical protein EDB86DRAFT_2936487 [Lactarius hatsudake]